MPRFKRHARANPYFRQLFSPAEIALPVTRLDRDSRPPGIDGGWAGVAPVPRVPVYPEPARPGRGRVAAEGTPKPGSAV